MKIILHISRQNGPDDKPKMVRYEMTDVDHHWSFLEMLDVLNERLIEKGEDPVTFDHDCREGICGSCGFMINGLAHGRQFAPEGRTTVCQMHMHRFADGDELYLEPWRARAFPVVKDLMVDRSSFDRVIQSGGYISVRTGNAQDGNTMPVPKDIADEAMNAAECIGCGACVASCKNASAMLFVSAKISHLGLLPQGQPERDKRAQSMVAKMDEEGFGNCTNQYECEAVCPKGISVNFISRMNADYRNSINKK
ncbi:MAG TPA: succinate dehydrogenase/fumarate reductase iron-sulfur subunit [Leptospiraceae bacterium]|nr:succinate dehydrogenase/fumarate reductase iron-sulfur subunit [Spirochaetaceae bacterium]HBS07056.1 succinate dehydrogenase/fumarate reductase iron-sulfur subunit [Leptospiraceae bacterium]|tara:strand:- start:202 stop:957 length:756 start_codon:yes stop_codon:yes gene_type:complete